MVGLRSSVLCVVVVSSETEDLICPSPICLSEEPVINIGQKGARNYGIEIGNWNMESEGITE